MNRYVIKYKDILYFVLAICMFQGILSDYLGFRQVNYLCDFLLMGLLFVRICRRQIYVINTKSAVVFIPIMAFMIVVLFGWIFNPATLPRAAWGMRNYGRFFLYFAFMLTILDSKSVNELQTFFLKLFPYHMLIVAYQYLIEGLRQDTLSGLFGKNVGGNGGLMIYLSTVVCIIMCQFEYKQISVVKFVIWILLIFVNAALSELKFLFILSILLVAWYLFMVKRKGRGMILALFFVIALYIGIQILYYVFPFWANYLSIDNILNMILDQKVYASQNDIGRTAVFSKLTPIIENWAGEDALFLGIGLGNGDYSSAFPSLNSAFYKVYELTHYTWLSLGYLFVETGYLGTIAYVAFFVVLEIKAIVSYQKKDTYFNLLGTFFPIICMVFLIYNSTLRSNFAYMSFAVLTWQMLAEQMDQTESFDVSEERHLC